MIRVLQKNNEILRIGTLQDRQAMGVTTSFPNHTAAVECLRRFIRDPYNMTVLRKVLYENTYQYGTHLLSDQDVISRVAQKVVRGQLVIARHRAGRYGGGSSVMKVAEQAKAKQWSKTEYVKSFLQEHAIEPEAEPAQETNWIAFKVLYDETDEPVAGVDLKIKLPDGSTDTYTTDGAGKIYISGLPDGTCDVQEMLDNDALEVVKVLAG